MKIFLVGGAVRDQILGENPKDKDYVIVGATKKDVESLIEKGYSQVGKNFPVFLHPDTEEEYALARKERKTGVGYHGFSCYFDENVTLEEDLSRRDLTINSIAYDLETKEYIDPFGGISDLKNKVFRNTSTSFREDPLRVLRLARFSCKYPDFSFSKEIREEVDFINKSGEYSSISKERIRKELEKSFQYNNPSKFFCSLKELGALNDFFPEIYRFIGVPQDPKYHPEGDAFQHFMLVLDNIVKLTDNLDCIYACLLHDLGKGITPKEILPQHIGHEEAGVPLVEEFCAKYRIGGASRKFIINFTRFHLKFHRCLEMSPKKIVKLFNESQLLQSDILEKMILCAKADSYGKENTSYPQEKFLMNCYKALVSVDSRKIVDELKESGRMDLLKIRIHESRVSSLKAMLRNEQG